MSNLNIYNGYLTGIDRELALEDAEIENMSSRIDTMWKMVNLEYEQNIRDAELKVFRENGTYDDLLYLYQEAENEASEKKQGLISKLFDFIASIFNTIGGWFSQLFGENGEKKPTPPPEAEQPEVIVTVVNGYTKAKNFIQKLFDAFTTIVTFGLNKKCGTVKAVFIELGVIGLIKSISDALGIDKIKEEVDKMPDDGGDSKKLGAKFREGFEELKTNGKKYRRDGESMINLALTGYSEWKWLNNIIKTCKEKIKEFEQKLEQRKAARAAAKKNGGANPPTDQQKTQPKNAQPSSGTGDAGANSAANKQNDAQPKDTNESSYNNQADINFIYNNPSSYLTEAENNPEAAPKEPANDQQSQEIDDDTHDNVLKDAAKKIADFITDIIALPFRLTIGAIMKIFHINADEQTDGQTGEQTSDESDNPTDGQDGETDNPTDGQDGETDNPTDGQDGQEGSKQENQPNEVAQAINNNSPVSISQLSEIVTKGTAENADQKSQGLVRQISGNGTMTEEDAKQLPDLYAYLNDTKNSDKEIFIKVKKTGEQDDPGQIIKIKYPDLLNRKISLRGINAILREFDGENKKLNNGYDSIHPISARDLSGKDDYAVESVNYIDFNMNDLFTESEIVNNIDDLDALFNSL
jgi:hypothetical protein